MVIIYRENILKENRVCINLLIFFCLYSRNDAEPKFAHIAFILHGIV